MERLETSTRVVTIATTMTMTMTGIPAQLLIKITEDPVLVATVLVEVVEGEEMTTTMMTMISTLAKLPIRTMENPVPVAIAQVAGTMMTTMTMMITTRKMAAGIVRYTRLRLTHRTVQAHVIRAIVIRQQTKFG